MAGGFRDLRVWHKAKELAIIIYRLTDSGELGRDRALKDQMRRAVVSIASNIAEGDERETDREAVRYFYIAKGSSAEVLAQAIIAYEIGYLTKEVFEEIEGRCNEISGMLSRLISARSKSFRP